MKHMGRCLVSRDGCCGYGESVHMMKDLPMERYNVRKVKQVAPSNKEDGPRIRNSL